MSPALAGRFLTFSATWEALLGAWGLHRTEYPSGGAVGTEQKHHIPSHMLASVKVKMTWPQVPLKQMPRQEELLGTSGVGGMAPGNRVRVGKRETEKPKRPCQWRLVLWAAEAQWHWGSMDTSRAPLGQSHQEVSSWDVYPPVHWWGDTPGAVNFQLSCPSSLGRTHPRPLEHLRVGSFGLDGMVYGWPPGWAQGSLSRGPILAPASKQTPAFAQMSREESGGGRWRASSRDQELCFSQQEMG